MMFAYSIAIAQPGDLDNTFGINGTVTKAIGVEGDFCSDIAVQEDGKILLVGTSDIGTNDNPLDVLTLLRYTAEGALDNSFSGDGITTFDLGGGVRGRSVAILPDGKILTAGTHGGSSNQDFLMAKFNSDGTVDMTFGTNGRVETDFASSNDITRKIHITPDGKIVLTGLVISTAGDRDFAVAQYNADGTPDVTFNGNGRATFDIVNDDDRCNSSTLQPDGKLLLIGKVTVVGNTDFAILRCQANGTLDNSFGTNGTVLTDFGTTGDYGFSVALQSNGKIIAVGITDLSSSAPMLGVVRYNTDGTLDNTFGTAGKASISVGNSIYNGSNYTVMQSDGKILITGASTESGASDITLVRLNANGTLDNTFGNEGVVTTDIGGSSNASSGIALQNNSKLLVAGSAFPNDDGKGIFTLNRYLLESNSAVISFKKQDYGLFIYPNPLQENVRIEYTLTNDETISIDLYDIFGRLVQSFVREEKRTKGDHKETLEMDASILSGSYILTLNNGEVSSSIRVVK